MEFGVSLAENPLVVDLLRELFSLAFFLLTGLSLLTEGLGVTRQVLNCVQHCIFFDIMSYNSGEGLSVCSNQ